MMRGRSVEASLALELADWTSWLLGPAELAGWTSGRWQQSNDRIVGALVDAWVTIG